jgi:hypothetical protein
MRNRLLICLLLVVPLISGFEFFFEDGSDGGHQTREERVPPREGPKSPLCPHRSDPYFCPYSKLDELNYGLKVVCVAHPKDCPCPIPGERKCPLGDDAYICIRDYLPCPTFSK